MITSLLNRQAWTDNLETDRDRDFIINGITNGFEIISRDSILKPAETNNYKSATTGDVRDKVENQIREEISKGNYVALGAIPKPDTDKIRLIHDCSRPQFPM